MQTFWERVILLLQSPSVVELASMLEVKRSTLSSWIHTDRRPPMKVLMKISKLTGLNLNQLEYGFDYKDNEEEEVAENLPQQKKQLSAMIEDLNEEELIILKSFLPYLRKQSLRNRTRKERS